MMFNLKNPYFSSYKRFCSTLDTFANENNGHCATKVVTLLSCPFPSIGHNGFEKKYYFKKNKSSLRDITKIVTTFEFTDSKHISSFDITINHVKPSKSLLGTLYFFNNFTGILETMEPP